MIQAGTTVAIIDGTKKAVAWTEIIPAAMEIINPSSFKDGRNINRKFLTALHKLQIQR